MKLPVSLQSWQAWLSWFQPEQAQSIGATLLRLNSLLGDNWGRLQSGTAEPNGIDDVRQRGPYHRLVLSEWSLADELPDEFMRRAANGEHLFLSPRLETRKSDEMLIALFDSGPDQIGPARLVHIALWILLARKAEQIGINFSWGVLQSPGVLHGASTAQMLKKLLQARTFKRVTSADWSAWDSFLTGPNVLSGERWFIGGTLQPSDIFSHRVQVQRKLGQGMSVEIDSARVKRKTDIPLPDPQQSSKLLRGMFSHEVIEQLPRQTNEKLALKQPPIIGINGEKVAIPLVGESSALIFPLRYKKKNEAKLSPKKVQWASQQELTCAVLMGKYLGGIIATTNHLFFWQLDGFRNVSRPPHDVFHAPPGLAHWLPCILLNGGGKPHRIYVLDYSEKLVCWTSYDPSSKITSDAPDIIDRDVLVIGRCDQDRLVYVRHRGQLIEMMLRHRTGTGSERLSHWPMPKKPEKAFVTGRPHRNGWHGAFCAPHDTYTKDRSTPVVWSIFTCDGDVDKAIKTQVSITPGWQVVGIVASDKNLTEKYALVALRDDKKNLALVTNSGSDVLYSPSVPISTVSVGSDCDLIACITEDRQLAFLSQTGQALKPWSPNGKDRTDD
jgi:hypothetical protein